MIHLNTDVTCRTLAFEDVHLYVLIILKTGVNADAKIGFGYLREGCQTRLEVLFLSLYFIVEVSGQRLVAQSRHKNCLRLDTWIC